jgi:hypothetical protein
MQAHSAEEGMMVRRLAKRSNQQPKGRAAEGRDRANSTEPGEVEAGERLQVTEAR